jgi:hypothetical protein
MMLFVCLSFFLPFLSRYDSRKYSETEDLLEPHLLRLLVADDEFVVTYNPVGIEGNLVDTRKWPLSISETGEDDLQVFQAIVAQEVSTYRTSNSLAQASSCSQRYQLPRGKHYKKSLLVLTK